MSQHSVVEAKNNLSELIERALRGEPVVITRHGKPVVELKAVESEGRHVTQADVDWLKSNRVGRARTGESVVDLISKMRDEDWR